VSAGAENHKGADGHTEVAQTSGSKVVKSIDTRMGAAVDVGPAPPNRVYTRDYAKTSPDKDRTDLVGPVLGNPLRW
jgi:hypothetical protein